MADDLLSLMQQWLKHMEQPQDAPPGDNPFNAWFSALQDSQPADSQPLTGVQAELIALLTQQSLEFTRFGQQLLDRLEQQTAMEPLDALLVPFQEHLSRLTRDWILRRWQLPEQLGALFHTHSYRDDLLLDNPFIHGLKSLLETPAQQGLQRDLQQQLQTLVECLLEYEQALRLYSRHYSEINTTATRRFISAVEQAEPAIESIAPLHALWIDIYEQCYGERIATDAYGDAHGRISNAVMALRQHLQHWRDRLLQQYGIPNATQLERVYRQLNEQRRQLKTQDRELRRLQDEIEALKQQISKPTPASAPPSQPQTDRSS